MSETYFVPQVTKDIQSNVDKLIGGNVPNKRLSGTRARPTGYTPKVYPGERRCVITTATGGNCVKNGS